VLDLLLAHASRTRFEVAAAPPADRNPEQGAFLDGHEDPALREPGTRELPDALGAALEREAATA
jgi:hypothetical protein